TATNDSNPCVAIERCSECIAASASCAWCTLPSFEFGRCDSPQILEEKGCSGNDLYQPKNEYNIEINDELTEKAARETDAIQLKPQRVRLKLRPHSPRSIKVQFKQAVDYPVDLYYLMDLSKSMEDDKVKLAMLGDLLAREMQRITSNFRLGFGSFVDKVAMPYVNMQEDKLEQPCTDCVRPYGFKNHMPLDTDTSQFRIKVNETRISGNVDAPEGGFDAIMQSIVCPDDIKWRKNSRKLLVFSTDAGFHCAGDGKLAGIVKPNDGQCHMSNGEYVESLSFDYPSVGQIHQKVKEHDVNIIFAVTKKHFDTYDNLRALISGSSAGVLEADSSNIVDLVKHEYQKITSVVKLEDNATSDVSIKYYSSCVNEERKETKECGGLRVGTTVEYDLDIEVLRCPSVWADRNQTIVIKPGRLSDQLIIDLEILCECDCEKDWNEEKFSPKCAGGHGTFECGICTCHANRYGDNCECDAHNVTQTEQEKACYKGMDSKPCSGRGECKCGKCKCFQKSNQRIYGTFCECDNLSCERFEGDICSGHGICDCGNCVCDPEWSGPDCSCYRGNDTCINPSNSKICSGKGTCNCGRCTCREDANGTEHYIGRYCEKCPTCPTRCDDLKPCVQCQVWQSGNYTKEQCDMCIFKTVEVSEEDFEVKEDETHCVFIDDDGCKAEFAYRLEEDDVDEKKIKFIFAKAPREKDCPVIVNMFLVVIGLILFIVLLGLLLLLLWKICVIIHDRREFAKFEKERQNAKWDTGENPIYKQATSTFRNPTYGGK
ncbi:integrin beta-PS-like protein, partial [Leptotrombidium deliense]